MKKFKTSILFGLLSIVLAACVGTGSETNKAPAVALTSQYKVKSLSVSVSKSVSLNELPRFANEPKEKTAENIKSYVNTAMKKHVVPAFIGAKPVNIAAEVTHVQFATNGGVIIMQAASYMSGTVTMKDAKTGTVIKTGNISITDTPFRGNGLGIIVALAANATTTPEKRYTSMTEKFAKEALLQLK
jgi:hypothetical protein